MKYNIPEIDLVVSRHESFVEYLIEEGIVDERVEIIGHATAGDVKGRNVIGALPPHLAVLTNTVTTVPIITPADMRGRELSLDEVRRYAREPETYFVHRWGGGLEQ